MIVCEEIGAPPSVLERCHDTRAARFAASAMTEVGADGTVSVGGGLTTPESGLVKRRRFGVPVGRAEKRLLVAFALSC